MLRPILLAGLVATASVTAQANFASPGFQYIGCVKAEPGSFSIRKDFNNSFSVSQCQDACSNTGLYAAITQRECYCDDAKSQIAVDFDIADEASCSLLCDPGNSQAGQCGGPDTDDSYQLFTLFQKLPKGAAGNAEAGFSIVNISTCTTTETSTTPATVSAPNTASVTSPCASDRPDIGMEASIRSFSPVSKVNVSTLCTCDTVKVNKTNEYLVPKCTNSKMQSWSVPSPYDVPDSTGGQVVVSKGSVPSATLPAAVIGLGALVLAFFMA